MRPLPVLLLVLLLTSYVSPPPCRVITARDYRVLRVVDGDTFKSLTLQRKIAQSDVRKPF